MPLFDKNIIAATFIARDHASRSVAQLRRNLATLGGPRMGPVGNLAGGFAAMGGAALGATAAIGGAIMVTQKLGELFSYATGQAINFEKQMATINTVTRVSDERLARLGDEIQAVARETGTSTDILTGAAYDLVSAGVQVDDVVHVLRDSAVLAKGALGTASEGVDLVTTVLNSYQLEAQESSRITDVFAKAVELGKTKLQDMAPVISTAATIAQQAGLEYTELAATFAFATSRGIDAASAMTNMRQAIVALLAPNSELKRLMEETGKNYAEIARNEGLHVALRQIFDDLEGNSGAFKDVLGRVQALQHGLLVSGESGEQYVEFLKEMEGALVNGGVAQDQFNIRMDTTAGRLEKLGARFQTFSQDIGEGGTTLTDKWAAGAGSMLDVVETVIGGIEKIEDAVKDFAGIGGADSGQRWVIFAENMARNLKAGAPAVEAAAEALFNTIPNELDLARKRVGVKSEGIPQDIADALRGNKQTVADAMEDLLFVMNNPLKRQREIARIEGALTGQALARGLDSSDPVVRAQALATQQILVDRWETLNGRSYQYGREAGQAYVNAYKGAVRGGLRGLTFSAPRVIGGLRPQYRAHGGPVDPGGAYVVGEQGPEMLVMGGRGGQVYANRGGMSTPIIVNVDGRRLFEIMDARLGQKLALGSSTTVFRG